MNGQMQALIFYLSAPWDKYLIQAMYMAPLVESNDLPPEKW